MGMRQETKPGTAATPSRRTSAPTSPREAKRKRFGRTKTAAGNKRKTRRKLRRRAAGGAGREEATRDGFPDWVGGDGCAASLVVAERVGGQWDLRRGSCRIPARGKASAGRGAGGTPQAAARIAHVWSAVGHLQRVRIMRKLLDGPTTYRGLQRVTKLLAGPLYHHINQLRLAGLILPKQRDLYELTRGGRNLLLAAMAVLPLVRDRRRRPHE